MNRKKPFSENASIGVFDSGLGGLTVVRKLRQELPAERIVYFGDLARLPYGSKSDEQIREFSVQNTEFLLRRKVKAVVIACNSSASAAFWFLKGRYKIPIIDVMQPAAREAAKTTRNQRIGVIGTQATISSRAYERAIAQANPNAQVFTAACPLLVPIVEEGILKGELVEMVLKRYLKPLLKHRVDTLVLGCTHYPLLRSAIQKVAGPKVRLIDSAPPAVRELKRVLEERRAFRAKKDGGELEVFASDFSKRFFEVAKRFLGHRLKRVKLVRFKGEVVEEGKWVV